MNQTMLKVKRIIEQILETMAKMLNAQCSMLIHLHKNIMKTEAPNKNQQKKIK